MTQNKKLVKKDAGEKYKDIELKDAKIIRDYQGGILKVKLKDTCNFFITSREGVAVNINFSYDNDIIITSSNDKDETEIKNLVFESVNKDKKLKIKLNKLLDGVTISDRE